MNLAAEGLRLFWARDIYQLTGKLHQGLREWIVSGDFIVDSVENAESFKIKILSPLKALKGLAFDSCRFSAATYETLLGIEQRKLVPRSSAWLSIESYYAAYFSMHSLLRLFGLSCTQLESKEIESLERSAKALLRYPDGITGFAKGYYLCSFSQDNSELSFKKITGTGGGSHEAVWKIFSEKLNSMSSDMVNLSNHYQPLATRLWELNEILCFSGCNGGNWLSFTRNQINYRHFYGTWHPYDKQKTHPKELIEILEQWKENPLKINIPHPKKDIVRSHIAACSFISSVWNCTILDMIEYCPSPRSFHIESSVGELRRIQDKKR